MVSEKIFKVSPIISLCKVLIPRVWSVVFVCFVALHPKSIAMVMAGRSVHLTTLFTGQA